MIIMKDNPISILKPTDIVPILRTWLAGLDGIERDQEHLIVAHLDVRHQVKLIEVVTIGTVNATLTHARETYRRAIAEGAAQILVAHNHPSHICEPSNEDIAVTKKLVEAGKII